MSTREKAAAFAASCRAMADRAEKGALFGTYELWNEAGAPCCVLGHVLHGVGVTPREAGQLDTSELVARTAGVPLGNGIVALIDDVTSINDRNHWDHKRLAVALRKLANWVEECA